MNQPDEKYLSYMLRLWRAVSDAGSSWRASLEDPRTGERQGFANLEGLYSFLQARVEEGAPPRPGGHGTGSLSGEEG